MPKPGPFLAYPPEQDAIVHAYIAELEDRVKRLVGTSLMQEGFFNLAMDRAVQAEAELEALKAQRCKTCAHADEKSVASELPDCVYCDFLHTAWRKTDGCSHWTARKEDTCCQTVGTDG